MRDAVAVAEALAVDDAVMLAVAELLAVAVDDAVIMLAVAVAVGVTLFDDDVEALADGEYNGSMRRMTELPVSAT